MASADQSGRAFPDGDTATIPLHSLIAHSLQGKQAECECVMSSSMHLVRSKANKAEASASLRLIDMSVTSHSTPVTTPSDPFTSILLLVY